MRTFFCTSGNKVNGQLKIARLPLDILLRFLAVICVLKVITIIEFGKIKSNNLK